MKQNAFNVCLAAGLAAALTSITISFAEAATSKANYDPEVYQNCLSLASNSYARSQIGRRNIHYSPGARKRERDLKAICAAYKAQGILLHDDSNFVAECRSAAVQNTSPLFRLRQDKVVGFQEVCAQMASVSLPHKQN